MSLVAFLSPHEPCYNISGQCLHRIRSSWHVGYDHDPSKTQPQPDGLLSHTATQHLIALDKLTVCRVSYHKRFVTARSLYVVMDENAAHYQLELCSASLETTVSALHIA